MINNVKIRDEDIVKTDYTREDITFVVRTMLRDFTLMAIKPEILEKYNTKIKIVEVATNDNVGIVYRDSNKPGPLTFHYSKEQISFNDLKMLREDNIGFQFNTYFTMPYDPNLETIQFEEETGCYMTRMPFWLETVEIYKRFIDKLRNFQ